jgi:uncharacterized protein
VFRIEFDRADSEPVVFNEELELPAAAGGEDVVSAGRVSFCGTVERASRGYRLLGEVQGAARLRCVRCLAEFPFEFAEPVELHLLPASSAPTEADTRLDLGELDARFYDEPYVDLVELAGEQFSLAVPMKPLCTAECRGLCPHCGANLNQGPCSCPKGPPDERFAPLLEWRRGE